VGKGNYSDIQDSAEVGNTNSGNDPVGNEVREQGAMDGIVHSAILSILEKVGHGGFRTH